MLVGDRGAAGAPDSSSEVRMTWSFVATYTVVPLTWTTNPLPVARFDPDVTLRYTVASLARLTTSAAEGGASGPAGGIPATGAAGPGVPTPGADGARGPAAQGGVGGATAP